MLIGSRNRTCTCKGAVFETVGCAKFAINPCGHYLMKKISNAKSVITTVGPKMKGAKIHSGSSLKEALTHQILLIQPKIVKTIKNVFIYRQINFYTATAICLSISFLASDSVK